MNQKKTATPQAIVYIIRITLKLKTTFGIKTWKRMNKLLENIMPALAPQESLSKSNEWKAASAKR